LIALAEWCLKKALAALGARVHPNLHAELLACAPLLSAYAWPGNVREVRNLMERLALFLAAEPLQALSPGFVLSVAPEFIRASTSSTQAIAPLASSAAPQVAESIAQVLARFNGNREAAAQYLGISRTTLWRKLKNPAMS